ncbi:MAG TPA: hypothetical protein VIJ49_05015, partial [Aestuariivirga sp.]
EFLWADFYRSRIALKLLKKNFTKGFVEAMEFSSSPDAAHLPGYISAQKSKKAAEAQKTLPDNKKSSQSDDD